MKWIEFMGPSGAGKSFLYERLVEHRTSNDSWITPEEAFEIVLEQSDFGMKLYLKRKFDALTRLLLSRKHKPFELIPSKYQKKAIDTHGTRFNFLSEIFIQEFADAKNSEPKHNINLISWYYYKVLLPFIVLHASNINRTIVFEDGIVHNNRGIARLDALQNMKRHVSNILEIDLSDDVSVNCKRINSFSRKLG